MLAEKMNAGSIPDHWDSVIMDLWSSSRISVVHTQNFSEYPERETLDSMIDSSGAQIGHCSLRIIRWPFPVGKKGRKPIEITIAVVNKDDNKNFECCLFLVI